MSLKSIFIVIILSLVLIGLYNIPVENVNADTVGRARLNDLKYTYFYSLTGSAPYARWINKAQGAIYDNTNSVLSATATWTDTDIALTTKMTTIGGWQVTVPAALPDGAYDLLIYDVSTAEGSRSNADAIYAGKHVIIENARIREMSDI